MRNIQKVRPEKLEHGGVSKKRSPASEYYHREKGKIMDALGGVCYECGTDENLEIHHIIPLAKKNRPQAERIREWKVSLKKNNLLLLCWPCHKKAEDPVFGMENETKKINEMD